MSTISWTVQNRRSSIKSVHESVGFCICRWTCVCVCIVGVVQFAAGAGKYCALHRTHASTIHCKLQLPCRMSGYLGQPNRFYRIVRISGHTTIIAHVVVSQRLVCALMCHCDRENVFVHSLARTCARAKRVHKCVSLHEMCAQKWVLLCPDSYIQLYGKSTNNCADLHCNQE